MITLNELNQVTYEKDGVKLTFKAKEDYKKIVIMLTDPIIKFDISSLEVDSNIQDERLLSICKKYKDFLIEFIQLRDEIIDTSINKVDELMK